MLGMIESVFEVNTDINSPSTVSYYLSTGTIPSELCDLAKLEILNLGINSLSGMYPDFGIFCGGHVVR